MSKAVMISIQPKWCKLIANGKKTIEVRKTKPKLETPFKVYIYETKAYDTLFGKGKLKKLCVSGGRVIGEFVCDAVISHCEMANADIAEQQGCIKREWLLEYAGNKELYGWHISDLVIYDKPRGLGEFIVPSKTGCVNEGKCRGCAHLDCGNGFNVEDDCSAPFNTDEYKPLRRPPQSWCYVEGGENDG